MPKPLATWNPARDVWETPATENLLCEHLDVYSETFPPSGTMLNGALYEHQTLAHHTSEQEFSSLPGGAIPTPSASDGSRGGEEPLQGTQLAGNTQRLGRSGQTGAPSNKGWSDVELFPTPKASDGTMGLPRTSGRPPERSTHLATRIAYGTPSGVAGRLLPTPNTMDSLDWREGEAREKAKQRGMPNAPKRDRTGNLREEVHFNFGEYEPAIERWEKISQRSAPEPVQPSATGRPQLAPAFSEWLMGLPDGWVTSPEIGLTRAQQLKALGNGVVPQQASVALADMWGNLAPKPPHQKDRNKAQSR